MDLLSKLADNFSNVEKFQCRVIAITLHPDEYAEVIKTDQYDQKSKSLWSAYVCCDPRIKPGVIYLEPDSKAIDSQFDGQMPDELINNLEGCLT